MFRPELPPPVAEVVRHLPPDVKRGVKQALRALSADPESGIPLARDLEGLWRYRVRRFRLVYAIDRSRRVIRILAVGHRRDVYEEVAARIRGTRPARRRR
ncbi:MAG: type II toxin-antitoxin system RelE family toxin [Candidatus Binatia bacterium]